MPDEPPSSPAAPGTPTRSRSTGATTTTSAPPARARRRPRHRRAARPRLAQPRRPRRHGSSTTAARRTPRRSHLQPLRWALRLVPGRRGGSISALCVTRAPTGAGSPGAARRGSRRGPGAGRSAPAAPSTSARAPSTRSTRELDEEWSVAPERVRVRGARPPSRTGSYVRRPGLAAPGAEVAPDDEHDDYAWWPADVDAWPAEADEPLRRMAGAAGLSALADPHLRPAQAASFIHSAIYLTLLVVWLVPGLHAPEFVFGMAHGVGWIAMCLPASLAVRARGDPAAAGVAVAVLGGVGPFVGTYEFVREEHRRQATRTFQAWTNRRGESPLGRISHVLRPVARYSHSAQWR